MADTHTGAPATGPPPDDGWHPPPGDARSLVADDTWTPPADGHVGADPEAPAGAGRWPPPHAGTTFRSPAPPAGEGTPVDPTGREAHDAETADETADDRDIVGEGGGDTAADQPYDEGFFAAIDPEAYASARVVVARVLGLTGARSVVDVGCGSGAWIRACRDLGVPEVVGVDGAYVPAEHRRQAT